MPILSPLPPKIVNKKGFLLNFFLSIPPEVPSFFSSRSTIFREFYARAAPSSVFVKLGEVMFMTGVVMVVTGVVMIVSGVVMTAMVM